MWGVHHVFPAALALLSINPRMLGCPSRLPKKDRREAFSQRTTFKLFA